MSCKRVFLILSGFGFGLLACTEQHDPRRDWKQFDEEAAMANRDHPTLTDEGKIPAADGAVAMSPIDKKYKNFCASCHGDTGAGDGPAGAALNPKPRNFVTWRETDDAYIRLIIEKGGLGVNPPRAATMAAWGGVLSSSDLDAMVEKVKSFRK